MPLPVIIASLIKAGFPIIAGAIASAGKEKIQEKLGVNVDELLGTDEGRLKLRQLELEKEEMLQEFILAQREQDIRADAMYLQDVADARGREVAIATSKDAPEINKVIVPYLALGVLGLTFLLFGLLIFSEQEITPNRKDIVIYILGVLSSISAQIVAYYFGSSKGSAVKDETINRMQGGTSNESQ